MTTEPTHVCPLADILFYNQIETTAFNRGEPADAENMNDRPSTFHVPELIPATAFESFLRAPSEQQDRDLREPLLAEATYPNGPSIEHLAMLTARANVIQSGINPSPQRGGPPKDTQLE